MRPKMLANSYLSAFCMELSMLLQSGAVPEDALRMLWDDEQDTDGKAVIQRMIDIVKKGNSLSAAFREAGYFPPYMVSMTEFAERTGRLAETLQALHAYYRRQERLAVSLRGALLYPSMLLVMMAAVVVILIVKVLPIFNEVFTMMGSRMSPMAARLMVFGRWLADVSAVIAVAVCVAVVAAAAAAAVPGIRSGLKNGLQNILGGGGIFAKIAALRFISAIALSVKGGLDTEEAVTFASAVSGGAKVVDDKNKTCMELIRAGKTLHEAMNGAGILSARDSRMLSIGSRSGRTDEAVEEIARRNDDVVQDDISRLVGRVESVLVLVTSVIVGVILFSVMLPMIGIMTSIG